jgi:twitching motility protein PilU
VKLDIPRFEDLKLPAVLLETVMLKQGLILIVGATDSGKSTTLAALIDHRNRHSTGHIVTIEDPIEYIHRHQRSIINQREVGVDTRSFHAALKNTLRQAPDVVLIGEIRDRETMEHALTFAETGHLVLSTLHAHNANQALERILNMFPEERRPQLLQALANNLKASVSQRLVNTLEGQRRAAVEVMIGTPTVADLIRRNELGELKTIMERSADSGMQTFNDAIYQLVVEGVLGAVQALEYADSNNNLRLKLKLKSGSPIEGDASPEGWGLI